MAIQKNELRRRLLNERRQLSDGSVKDLSLRIMERFCSTDFFNKSEIFHIYYPINNEVDTRPLIELLWRLGRQVVMPRTSFEQGTIVNYSVHSFDELVPTRFSMLEPDPSRCEVHDAVPDLVIVPGVAFSMKKERLGYGGGFYDRFLGEIQAWKIAFAYDMQVKSTLPVEKHDILMDAVITENSIIH